MKKRQDTPQEFDQSKVRTNRKNRKPHRATFTQSESFGGQHCSIEVKTGRDRVSKEQKRATQLVQYAGGLYFVARDFQSFHDWVTPLLP